jgi:hypothetical protein
MVHGPRRLCMWYMRSIVRRPALILHGCAKFIDTTEVARGISLYAK